MNSDQIREQIEILVRELEQLLALRAEIDRKIEKNADMDRINQAKLKEIDSKEADLATREEQLLEEKKYISRKTKEIELAQQTLTKDTAMAEERIQSAIEREEKALAQEEKANETLKETESINLQKEEIKRDRELIEREKVIDRERKSQLETQEAFNKKETERLQRIASSYK